MRIKTPSQDLLAVVAYAPCRAQGVDKFYDELEKVLTGQRMRVGARTVKVLLTDANAVYLPPRKTSATPRDHEDIARPMSPPHHPCLAGRICTTRITDHERQQQYRRKDEHSSRRDESGSIATTAATRPRIPIKNATRSLNSKTFPPIKLCFSVPRTPTVDGRLGWMPAV